MKLGVIGGTGAQLFPGQGNATLLPTKEPWGPCSTPVVCWQQHAHEVLFLARHGDDGVIPPHRVNYRANIQALKDLGAEQVIALNAVGGIAADAEPGKLVLPDQLLDYTWGREHTYFDGQTGSIEFIDFTEPYDYNLRNNLERLAEERSIGVKASGVYGATQGPRLETAAEIRRLESDGADIVGMTGMPEAALAREAAIPYVSLCFVVNWAAGKSAVAIHEEIDSYLRAGIANAQVLIDAYLQSL